MPLNVRLSGSLKTRVTLFTLAIFVASLWSLAFFAGTALHEDVADMLGEQQRSTVSLLAAQVDNQIQDRFRALERVAKDLTPALLRDPPALQALLDQRPVLQGLFNGGITVLSPDGTAIADSPLDTGRVGRNFQDIDYVASTLREGKAAIGMPILGPVLRQPVFGMAAPVLDGEGRVIGALSGVTNLALPNFLEKVTGARYGRTGVLVIVARGSRRIVTATDKRFVLMGAYAAGVDPLINRFMAGYEGSGTMVNPLGMEVLASAKGVPSAGWYVAAGLPTEEAFAPIHAMESRLLYATLAFSLLAGGLTWWILRRELAPMVAAAAALADRSAGRAPLRPLPIARHDEIGELIGGFNRLLETLARREETLALSEARSSAIARWAHDAIVTTDSAGTIIAWNQGAQVLFGHAEDEILGQPATRLMPARHGDLARAALGRLAAGVDESLQGELHELTGLRKDGSEVPLEISLARWEVAGAWFVTAIVRDVTRRLAAERQLRESEAIFGCFLRNSPMLVFVTDEHLRAVRLSGNFEAFLGQPLGQLLGQAPDAFFPPELAGRMRVETARVLRTGEPITREDEWGGRIYATTRFPIHIEGHARYVAGYAVDVTERRRGEDAARLGQAQLRQLAVQLNRNHEAESGMLSRELHDEFGQLLTSLKMDLSAVAAQLEAVSPELKRKVVFSMALIDASVDSVHRIAARLRPRILDELGLASAIDSLVQDFRERTGLDAAFVGNGPVDSLTQEQTTAVYRIVQESLSNIIRHADARRVDVSLGSEDGELTLEVRDDGKGMHEDHATSHESIGLLGMRERALAAGGEVTVKGVPGRGTIVTLRLPLAQAVAA